MIGSADARTAVQRNFIGNIDQVRVFPTALIDSQVSQLFNEKPETDTNNFKATLYSGNNVTTGNYVSNVGFQPDFVWIKPTSTSGRHLLQDVVNGPSVYEGAGLTLHTNETFTSNTYGEFTAFEANGFIVQFSSGSQYFNNSGRDYVAWNWKAGGDAVNIGVNSITGSTPSIASDVSANTAAGFSIAKVTFNTTSPQTVAHGLLSPPEFIISKRTSMTSDWNCYHKFIDGTSPADYLIKLNSQDGRSDNSIYWNDTLPTDDVFTTGSIYDQDETVTFYCWHSVPGYSKIGGYAGSGNSQTIYVTNDGTSSGSGGFKPSWVIIKNRTAGSSNWMIYDAVRDTDGTLSEFLEANTPDQEATASSATITPISNGFTIGNSNSLHLNDSTDNFIYMAFK